ncbi:RagB/SusD family nutrient uptake outer membrane protein [Puteibacter caeruleilacunae]|nr:RagB/SusD family nutrient uptake outer membrane protein [Puteibacter caeruleilacunae]
MKYMNRILLLVFVLTTFYSCDEDFLERYPLDAISDAAYWNTEKDLQNYVNGLYDILPSKRGYSPKYDWENGTDNIIGDDRGITMLHGNLWRTSSDAPQNSSTWNGAYSNLRKINYFLEQKEKAGEDVVNSINGKHFVGEALFFRAWVNFGLLRYFGTVPYVAETYTTDSEELYNPQVSRDVLAGKIIEDLNTAIEKLSWRGEGPAKVSGRINKEAALGLKARVALFEGTWEYYHNKANTPFKVSGKDGSAFLNDVVSAGDQLIAKLGTSIYTKDYNSLFNQDSYSSIDEALMYRHYLPNDGIGHRWWNYTGGGGGAIGLTKSLIDDYLMADGTPIELSGDYKGDDLLADVVDGRDPRLAQTIYHPGLGSIGSICGRDYAATAPGIIASIAYYKCSTGYFAYKGVAPQDAQYAGGPAGQGLILMRYAETLLAYAEAKAILGTLTQGDLDKTVNVLRDRVSMTHMNLVAVNGWSGAYQKRYATESNIINEIRRERRVELALEGLRYDDLRRWAALGQLKGWVPRGAKAQQFLDYAASPEGEAVGYDKLTAGSIKVDSEGYILPIGHRSDFQDGGTGFDFDPKKDYLNGIPKAQITLYKEKGNVDLTQNPGWN